MAAFGQSGIALSGIKETNNPSALLNYMNSNGGFNLRNIDSAQGGTPWCAGFVNAVLGAEGYKGTGSLAAASFRNYGQAVNGDIQVGDVAVFKNISHVGIVTGFDDNGNPLVLQGNSGSIGTVKVESEDASKLIFRRPTDSNGKTPVENGATGSDGRNSGGNTNGGDSQNGATASSGGQSGNSQPDSGSGNPQATTSSQSSAQPIPGQGGYLDNPLNPYAQIAYHWTFFVTGEKDSDDAQPSQGKIIAETGASGFNIKSVTMNGFCGPNAWTRTSVQTDVKLEITEAMGSSFLDGLILAHQLQGTKNYQKAHYWLELYFKGYQESGAAVNTITEGMPVSDGKWRWKVFIQNIDTHTTEAGANYVLTCSITHDAGLQEEWNKLQNPIQLTADTVGEFFKTLAGKLNDSAKLNYGTDFVTYEWQFMAANGMPDPSQYKLRKEDAVPYAPMHTASTDEGTRDKWSANLQRGQNLSELAELVIAVTQEGHSLVMFGDDKHIPGDINAQAKGDFRVSVLYRSYPKVTQGDYDPLTGNYKKKITYVVKPFQTQRNVMNPDEVTKNVQQSVKFATPNCRKRYDYIFTGLNTEITGLDLKFSVAWQAVMPRLVGYNYYTEQVTEWAMVDKDANKTIQAALAAQKTAASGPQAQANLGNSILGQSQGLLGQAAGIAGQVGGLLNSVGATGAGAAVGQAAGAINGLGGLLNSAGAAGNALFNQQAVLNAQAAQQTRDQTSQALNNQLNQQLQTLQQNFGGSSGGSYIEDDLEKGGPSFNLVSIAQNAEGARRAAGSGVMGVRNSRGRSVYGALIDQVYENIAYMNLELTIRGDPFWLGGKLSDRFSAQESSQSAPNWTAGDQNFTLIFKYPSGLHESTGQVQFKPESTYTGLYCATAVESRFIDGKFEQVLKAHRMPKIDGQTATTMNNGSIAGAGASPAASTGSGSTTPTPTPSTTAAGNGLLNGGTTNAQNALTNALTQSNGLLTGPGVNPALGDIARTATVPNTNTPANGAAPTPIQNNPTPTTATTDGNTISLNPPGSNDSDWA